MAQDALVIDGRQVRDAGLIDDHSHLGVYAAPWRQRAQRRRGYEPSTLSVGGALGVAAGPPVPATLRGVTTLQVLPGSANLIGGRSVYSGRAGSQVQQ